MSALLKLRTTLPGADAILVITMKVSKGLALPVVALPGVGLMPLAGGDEKEKVRLFYVAATRRLVITTNAGAGFGKRVV